MEISEGMYVRKKNGRIAKIIKIINRANCEEYLLDIKNSNFDVRCENKHILKASYKIIDLIEEGDYVNGRLYHDNLIWTENYGWIGFDELEEEDIKSIVTKEQMESITYEVK